MRLLFLMSLVLTGAVSAAPPERTVSVDAVAIAAGKEVDGVSEFATEHEGYVYTFSTKENKAAFDADPAKFAAADGGACGSMGPLAGLGNAKKYIYYNGRLFFFASESCRETFTKNPAKYVETDDPVAVGTPEQIAAGAAVLDRLVKWAGGAEKLGAIKTYRHTATTKQPAKDKDWTIIRSLTAEFPARFAAKEAWDDLWYTTIGTPEGGAMGSFSGGTARIAAARARAFERSLGRVPVVILLSRGEPGFVAVGDGEGSFGGASVDFVLVSLKGATSRLAVEKETGRLVGMSFRGRDGTRSVGDNVRTFTAYATVDGVTLPKAWKTTFNATEVAALDVTLDGFEINPRVESELFALEKN